ncbi:hypothetical protein MtrunA17_Chr5g0426661 [Medicago truncatula]|uniref:Uncharacterized protein n=1 Tax=Medicago truncatula TaxID=3880 RepID=A0A396HS52_MEDTR|nr:uncharacterized protein LOC11425993 [Medicago truncatula]RHN56179.1 hypothetical protein MtrunA17_Chr5g0426661 [Medicago truncatula]
MKLKNERGRIVCELKSWNVIWLFIRWSRRNLSKRTHKRPKEQSLCLKQSTRRVLSLVAELMSLEEDTEHLRVNLDRAEEEGKLLSVENGILEKENRRLVMKYKERSHTESGGKLTNSSSAKSNKRKSSSKTSSSMAKKVDFDDLDSVSPRQALSPLQSNSVHVVTTIV